MQPLWERVWRFLRKLKLEPPYDPAIALLDVYLKKPKTLIQKDARAPLHGSVIYQSQETEAP